MLLDISADGEFVYALPLYATKEHKVCLPNELKTFGEVVGTECIVVPEALRYQLRTCRKKS